MRIVVCGAGSTGRHVAQVLGEVHDVTVIDLLEERRVAGRRVTELAVPEGAALTAVVREDQVLLPERAGALRARDIVVALCEPGREHVLHDLLTGR